MSALCGVTAVVFVVRDDFEKAFIAAALGAVSWFLSYRVRLRETLGSRDETDGENADDEEQS